MHVMHVAEYATELLKTPCRWNDSTNHFEYDASYVHSLLAAGADPNIVYYYYWLTLTPLMEAIEWDSMAGVELLLKYGADINLQTGGRTALMCAVVKQDLEFAELLLQQGADPNLQPKCGSTAVSLAAGSGSVQSLQLLLKHGGDPNLRNNGYNSTTNSTTPLMAAAAGSMVDSVMFLLEQGADIDLQSQSGESALHYAVKKEPFDADAAEACLKLLLERGAGVNLQSLHGATALHCAFSSGLVESWAVTCAQLLLEHGADPNVQLHVLPRLRSPLTPLAMAIDQRNLQFVKCLLEHSQMEVDMNIDPRGTSVFLMFPHNGGFDLLSAVAEPLLRQQIVHAEANILKEIIEDREKSGKDDRLTDFMKYLLLYDNSPYDPQHVHFIYEKDPLRQDVLREEYAFTNKEICKLKTTQEDQGLRLL